MQEISQQTILTAADDTNSGSFVKRPDGMLDPDPIQACHEFRGCTELTCTKLKVGKTL